MATPTLCPCNSARPYEQCCAPLHRGEIRAETAEQLMRSRYAAFVLSQWDYVHTTWHPQTCPTRSTLTTDPQMKWLGLQVLTTEQAGAEAFVEFVARYKHNGHAGALRERSRFVFEGGRWFYIDGIID